MYLSSNVLQYWLWDLKGEHVMKVREDKKPQPKLSFPIGKLKTNSHKHVILRDTQFLSNWAYLKLFQKGKVKTCIFADSLTLFLFSQALPFNIFHLNLVLFYISSNCFKRERFPSIYSIWIMTIFMTFYWNTWFWTWTRHVNNSKDTKINKMVLDQKKVNSD